MNYQWRSPRSRINNVDSPSSISPLTVGNRFENAIPPGTVASRVRFLQSFANTDSTRLAPTSPSRHRETSRTGYGRRITSRFGAPAFRNVNPDEQPTVENSHTFLGLNSPRINHSEEHAIADHRVRYDRNAELNDRTKPPGLRERLQYDAGTVPSKVHSEKSMRRECSGHKMDVLKEVDSSGSRRHSMAQTSIFPSSANEDTENRDTYRRETRPRKFDTERSDASAVTTSTIRRQSVRDLFYHYNIERPAGLASSSEDASRAPEDTLRPTMPHRYCHVCSWVNSGSQKKCWRCGHRLCPECDALSPFQNMRKEADLDYVERVPTASKIPVPISQPTPLKLGAQEPADRTLVRPGPSPVRKPQEELPRDRNHSGITIKFPSFHEGKSSQRKKFQKPPAPSIKIPEQTKLLCIQSTSRTNTNVKDSPFVIADQILSGEQSIGVLPIPINVRISNHHSHHSHHVHENEHHNHGSEQRASSSSNAGDCDSPTCRATHHGHAPFRHAVTCTRKKRRVEETDNGYVADISRVEDASHSKDHSHSQYSYVSRPNSRAAYPSRPSSRPCSSLSEAKQADVTHHLEVPEYVECRGYPRTGHARHGSPTTSGVVGECQHCLDDCQCAACQSTHHNVRCCVHEDHHAVIHHHHTPRKGSTEEPNPLELSLSPTRSPDQTAAPPPQSPARTPSTVIPSSAHSRTSTPLISRDSPSPIAPLQLNSRKATLGGNAALPVSKSSTFKKEASRPPTPPPWVSMPKVRTKATVMESVEQISRCATTDTASAVTIDPYPSPPFKEMSTLPPPATCDESSPEMSGVPTEGPWVTVHPDHGLEHDHARRESCILISPKESSLDPLKSPSVGIPSRIQDSEITPSEARRTSRRISSMFKLRQTRTVPLLNQKLQEHQKELRRIEKECDKRLEVIARGGLKCGQNNLPKETGIVEKRVEQLERTPSAASRKEGGMEKQKRWKLRLVDRKPSPKCQNDKTVEVEEHGLSDDEVVDDENDCKKNHRDKGEEEHRFSDYQVVEVEKDVSSKIASAPDRRQESHECVWKSIALEGQPGQRETWNGCMGIKGITLLIHLDGREDLVVKADL